MSLPPPPAARLTVDLDAIAANWRTLARRAGVAAGAAIKADGYGLGAGRVARRLVAEGCRDLFVASWAEALALGTAADGATVHVLHGIEADELPAARALPQAQPVLNRLDQAALWHSAEPGRACDLMIDTGMNRLGLAAAYIALLPAVHTDVLMSHLACADDVTSAANARQRTAFAAIALPHRRRSLAASAGIYLGRDYAFDLVRPGLALFGGVPSPAATDLMQAVQIEARVLQCRRIAAGEAVGYGATWVAQRPTELAILGIGYADGLPRAPGGMAVVDGVTLPVVGRVSMDLTAMDFTDAARAVHVGQWVEIDFDLPRAAVASGRSQYELLTGLGRRFERRYVPA